MSKKSKRDWGSVNSLPMSNIPVRKLRGVIESESEDGIQIINTTRKRRNTGIVKVGDDQDESSCEPDADAT